MEPEFGRLHGDFVDLAWCVRSLQSHPRVDAESITAVLSARVPVLKFLFYKKEGTTVEVRTRRADPDTPFER